METVKQERLVITTTEELQPFRTDFKTAARVIAKTITDPHWYGQHWMKQHYHWTYDLILEDMGLSDGFDYDLLLPAMRYCGLGQEYEPEMPYDIQIPIDNGGIRQLYTWLEEAVMELKGESLATIR